MAIQFSFQTNYPLKSRTKIKQWIKQVIEAKGKKTLIHLKNGILEASQSLTEMGEMLPAGEFCMPIRWALVSMKEIMSISGNTVKLTDQTEIPVSRGKKEEIRKTFADYKWAAMRRRMRGR